MKIPLDVGKKWAGRIRREILPFCERVDVAGSIRRGRPIVHDIDLVAIPRDMTRLKERCLRKAVPLSNGNQNFRFELSIGLQVEIYFAWPKQGELFAETPSNFGSLWLCRTGSREHNIHLVEHAKTLGLRWRPYVGVFDAENKLIASETERDIFSALGLDFIPPERRER